MGRNTTKDNNTNIRTERSLLTIPEAARRLNVSRGYVYALLKRGELVHVELPSSGGRRSAGAIRIDPTDLENAITAMRKGGDTR